MAVDVADLAPSAPGAAVSGRRTITIRRVSRLAQPVTIRLPGKLTRALALGRADIDDRSTGPALDLKLRPTGNVLIEDADLRLRVLRQARTVFTHAQTLGQLFPGSPVALRIPWDGKLQPGPYRVLGIVRPAGAPVVRIDTVVALRPATPLPTTTPGAVEEPVPGSAVELPAWLRAALGGVALTLLVLAVAVAALWRRSRRHAATPAAVPAAVPAAPAPEPEPQAGALSLDPEPEPGPAAPEQPVRPAELILAAPAEEVEVLDVARALGKVCAVRAHRAIKDVQTRSAHARRRRELELGTRRR